MASAEVRNPFFHLQAVQLQLAPLCINSLSPGGGGGNNANCESLRPRAQHGALILGSQSRLPSVFRFPRLLLKYRVA